MADRIEYGLALALAGQVAVGLAEGDGREARQEGALTAIGLMLINATRGDEAAESAIADVLNAGEGAKVTIEGGMISVVVEGQEIANYDEGEETTPAA